MATSQQRPILPASKPSTSSSVEPSSIKKPITSNTPSMNYISTKQVCWKKKQFTILLCVLKCYVLDIDSKNDSTRWRYNWWYYSFTERR